MWRRGQVEVMGIVKELGKKWGKANSWIRWHSTMVGLQFKVPSLLLKLPQFGARWLMMIQPYKKCLKKPSPSPKSAVQKEDDILLMGTMDGYMPQSKKQTINTFFIRSQWIRHHMDSQNHYRVYTQHCIFWSNKMLWNYWNMVFNDKQLESTTFV